MTTLVLIALLVPAMAVLAQPGHGRMDCDHHRMGRMMGHGDMPMGRMGMPGVQRVLMMADELELTEPQQNQLKGMLTDFQTEKIDKEAEVKKARVQLRALMAEQAGDGEVNAAIDQVTRLEGELKKMRYRHHTAVRDVLTEEQREQIRDMMKQRMKGMMHRGDGSGQRGMGKGWRHGMMDES
ncbi:hypothetical protein GF420_10825 [candidate division GN15 bacterium]|nr:hypothetical protein [candidate division GN15 bacterium]